ncbi:aquaporin family protein [Flavihumibacter rivuli]|uniref:MIP/aquaporin family protein n=1 Tax=Flavihumibacter rivuli TaxID=2838156 RepID=UPI001BDDE8BC|nr:MIP/aquaporin family protein [Flavihumibacter rivuli]ULQ55005.1 aquaporin family protein [Flavihumibacter rivuli]
MSPLLGEFLGSAILILFGDGVVANVLLDRSKGQNSGWIVISFGWAMAVFVAVFCVAPYSGAHLNPAVTLALSMTGKFGWDQLPGYWLAQLAGTFTGAILVWLTYRGHFTKDQSPDLKLGIFCTSPAIRNAPDNFLTEGISTFVFILAVLLIVAPDAKLGALDALPVALLVLAVGLSLGGPTGYAINPARDLGPRLAHLLLPIPGKRDSDWGYAWVPILAPMIGAATAAFVYQILQN